ncbi:D-2-hydroxyacid dehydrogenase [Iamia majanohamensis]|uniref:D-2-hydroxyacid dehydrogenase n=1 Tax=Iamia majanohamensis TaxID=467976 RepID=A0AAE9YAM6_9ACTN|nr:D-2-hydroxyacid dehydrogenase [Iamia majanohamensis]WCO67638.1 D-2-hydroxyacid dehydrogenase [Iamia majanohamensis]
MTRSAPVVVVVEEPGAPEPPGLDALAGCGAAVHVVRTEEELAAVAAEADVVAIYDFRSDLLHRLDGRLGAVTWVHAASAGLDAVLSPEVVARRAAGEVVVTNARGTFDRPIAEFVLAVLLLFAKDLRTTLDHQVARRWVHRDTEPLAGRRVLVVGAGSIGRATARLLGAVGMEVAGVARRARPDDPDMTRVVGADRLHDELAHADDVVVCAPLTAATRGMFDAEAFAAMRPGARFVNVGRGAIVDEDALLAALRSGHVGAAALDVFATEPLPDDHPFWAMEQVVVSPHQSGDEVGWRGALTRQLSDELGRWQRGEPLLAVVDDAAVEATVGTPAR